MVDVEAFVPVMAIGLVDHVLMSLTKVVLEVDENEGVFMKDVGNGHSCLG